MNKIKTKKILWPIIFSLSIFLSFQFSGGGRLEFLSNKVCAQATSELDPASTNSATATEATATETSTTQLLTPVLPPPPPNNPCDSNPCKSPRTQCCPDEPAANGVIFDYICCLPEPDQKCEYPTCTDTPPSALCSGTLVQNIPAVISENDCMNNGGIVFKFGMDDRYCCLGCGNGKVGPGEECDDGNRTPGDGCSEDCKIELCGNRNIDPDEECDDGNKISCDGCSKDCKIEHQCTADVTGACLAGYKKCDPDTGYVCPEGKGGCTTINYLTPGTHDCVCADDCSHYGGGDPGCKGTCIETRMGPWGPYDLKGTCGSTNGTVIACVCFLCGGGIVDPIEKCDPPGSVGPGNGCSIGRICSPDCKSCDDP